MSSTKVFFPLAVAAACLLQVSCGSGPVDLRNPTISELDAADQSWGLAPRKQKGGAKRTFQYPIEEGGAPATGTSAPAPQRTEPSYIQPSASPTPLPPPEPALDPSAINKLR